MSPPGPSADNPTPADAEADRCLRYLFAELPPPETLAFEQELRENARLRDTLENQAATIAEIGIGGIPEAAVVASAPSLAAGTVVCDAADSKSLGARSWRRPVLYLAFAATLLICVSLALQHYLRPSTEWQDSQLAAAWAETRFSVDPTFPGSAERLFAEPSDASLDPLAIEWESELSELAPSHDAERPFPADPFDADAEELVWEPEDSTTDDPPSWLIAAVSGVESQETDQANGLQESADG